MTVPTFAEVVAHPQRFLDRIKFDNEAVAAHLERNAPNPDPEEFAQFAGMSSSGADAVWLAYMFAPASEVAENVFTLVDMLAVMPGRDRVRFVSPLTEPEHKRVAMDALRYVAGQLSASRLAAAHGVKVPDGRPVRHPQGVAKAAARAVTLAARGAGDTSVGVSA